jgi:hypothetical protein
LKKILLLFVLSLVIFSCSSPKYTYYFDRVKAPAPVASSDETPLAPVNPETLVASTETASYEVTIPAPAMVMEAPATISKRDLLKSKVEALKALRHAHRESKALSKKDPTAAKALQTGKATKGKAEGLAIAGFVIGIVGWFIPNLGLAAALLVLGVIFSALGLKGERRGLAIAGLVISIVGLVIVLILGGSATS